MFHSGISVVSFQKSIKKHQLVLLKGSVLSRLVNCFGGVIKRCVLIGFRRSRLSPLIPGYRSPDLNKIRKRNKAPTNEPHIILSWRYRLCDGKSHILESKLEGVAMRQANGALVSGMRRDMKGWMAALGC